MKRVRGRYRPNVLPAKCFSPKEYVNSVTANMRKGFTKPKTSIEDLCDFCLKPTYFNKGLFKTLKPQGYKGVCYKCFKQKKLKIGKGIKIILASRADASLKKLNENKL